MASYLIDSEGKFIPASQRPDGTWRKARRVKEGYVPQEEVPLYESKGKQFAQRKANQPVGMIPLTALKKFSEKDDGIAAKKLHAAGTAAGVRVQHVAGVIALPKGSAAVDSHCNSHAAINVKPAKTKATSPSANSNNTTTHATISTMANDLAKLQLQKNDQEHISKKLKKLRKKIREIESIEAKLKSGVLAKPEKDQLEKVKRKKDIVIEIQQLEQAAM